MANYTNMVTRNQKRSRDLQTLAIGAINEMVADGEKISVTELVNRTGCCRAYFYTNKEVNKALEIAREKQTGKIFIKPQKAILDEATKRENDLLRQRIMILEQANLQLNNKLIKQTDDEFNQIQQL